MLRRTISVPHTGGQRMHFPRRLAATSASVMLGLGVAALINTAMARNAERRNPPKGTFLEVDGVRLHYLEKGSGLPVVLLHGNQSMADDFAISGVIDLLAKKYRVIAFDRPGFGYSERPGDTVWTPSAQADLIRKALLRLGVEKSLMVGHSWGTLVALAYGLQNPRRPPPSCCFPAIIFQPSGLTWSSPRCLPYQLSVISCATRSGPCSAGSPVPSC